MFNFLVSLPVDAPPACLERNRQKPGNKARLYCGRCQRERCLFRPTMTPAEYKAWQLGEHEPLPVEDVSSFVLEVLADWGEATTEQLRNLVGLSASHFWKHLDTLREKGLVVSCGTGNGRELAWRLKGMDVLIEPSWVQELFFGDFEIVEPVVGVLPVCWTEGSPFDEVLVGEPVWGWEV